MNEEKDIVCMTCIHKKVDYKQQLYCEKVNKIPKSFLTGEKKQCSFYTDKADSVK